MPTPSFSSLIARNKESIKHFNEQKKKEVKIVVWEMRGKGCTKIQSAALIQYALIHVDVAMFAIGQLAIWSCRYSFCFFFYSFSCASMCRVKSYFIYEPGKLPTNKS